MGVRINSSVSAAKASASAQQATPKKDGQPAAGTDTDFSQVLAKAQPKKKADAAPPSDKPAPAVAKAAGKKPAKAKAKDDQTDDAQAVTPGDPAAKRPEVADDGDDTTPIEDVDSDTTPVSVTDDGDDSEGDTASIINSQQPVVVQTDPAQFIAQATPTPPPPPPPPPSPRTT